MSSKLYSMADLCAQLGVGLSHVRALLLSAGLYEWTVDEHKARFVPKKDAVANGVALPVGRRLTKGVRTYYSGLTPAGLVVFTRHAATMAHAAPAGLTSLAPCWSPCDARAAAWSSRRQEAAEKIAAVLNDLPASVAQLSQRTLMNLVRPGLEVSGEMLKRVRSDFDYEALGWRRSDRGLRRINASSTPLKARLVVERTRAV